MEELLRKIETGLNVESDSLIETVKNRTAVLNQYSDSIRSLVLQLKELGKAHFQDYEKNLALKTAMEQELSKSKTNLADTKKKIAEAQANHDEEVRNKEANIQSLTEKECKLSNKIDTCITEQNNLYETLAALRLSESTFERSVGTFRAEEKLLIDSLAKKKEELGALSTDEMNLKRQINKLSDLKTATIKEIKETQ